MDANSLIIFLAIGALAGWLAGIIMKGKGFGIIGNIVVGIIGAFFGGFLFNFFGIAAGGLLGSLITATVGAVVLLFLVSLVKRG
ncbi:MAG: GlsB/YeaQ/YmgE family stress response membrane protein [Desulfurivibrionaceae bacterium]|nr:GlsB/YeaQ/YmgE family stress response membrane protein [Desulfurivibrionaceae bacterium]